MYSRQHPPTLGIVAAAGYVAVALAPYLLLDPEPGILEFYYSFGLAGPPLLSLFAVVAVVMFAAGRQGRTEPDLIAGLTLVLGLVLAVITFHWAISVPETVVAEVTDATWFEYQRWIVAGIAVLVPLASAWYARALELF